MRFYFLLLSIIVIFLPGCSDENHQSPKIKISHFTHKQIQICVENAMEKFGWVYVEDVEVLRCANGGNLPISQDIFAELDIFTNLTTLELSFFDQEYPIEFNAQAFPNLESFSCRWCSNFSFDFSANPNLEKVVFSDVMGTSFLDLSQNKELLELELKSVQVERVLLSPNSKLKSFSLSTVFIGIDSEFGYQHSFEMNWQDASMLESFVANHAKFNNVSLNSYSNLKTFDVGYSYFDSLHISSSSLKRVQCKSCQLQEFDPSQLPSLEELILTNNEIQYIDLDDNPKLKLAYLDNNPFRPEIIEYLESLPIEILSYGN